MTKSALHKNSRPNYVLVISRWLTGALFVFSGLIKANDPTGFAYKLQEYFQVFGLNFLNDFAVIIAVLICGLEILLGALLLLGFWANVVAWGLLLLILFFTFLTFYSAFFEVVSSCGCFGDAIPLTPWESFIKDLVLLALILVIFKYRKEIHAVTSDFYTKAILTVALAVLSIGIGIYTVNFLPIIDFLPYKKGNHLPSLMVMPEGARGDVYELTYSMKNNETGETRTVSDQVYMDEELWKDETWEIEGEPESRLVERGYEIPIPDLLITDAEGNDRTYELIDQPEYSFLVVAWDLEKTNTKALDRVNKVVGELATNYHLRPVLLTASAYRYADGLSNKLGLFMETYHADGVPLKSMVRANPGIVLLKDGTVVNKWHYNTFPNAERLDDMYFYHED